MNAAESDPLAPLAALPGVAAACDEARDALAAVHRHRANLRGWTVTGAESALRGGRASAGVEGADVRVDSERVDDPVTAGALRVAAELHGPALDRATGVWTRSPLQQLAHMHVLAAAGEGVAQSELGRPREAPGVAERLRGLADLVVGGTTAPGPVVAAVVHGELATLRPFGTGDGVVARAASRLVSVSTGFDPHCLGVPEVSWFRRPDRYRAALEGFASGTPEGLAGWLLLCCASFVDGAREARSIADAAG